MDPDWTALHYLAAVALEQSQQFTSPKKVFYWDDVGDDVDVDVLVEKCLNDVCLATAFFIFGLGFKPLESRAHTSQF